MMIWGVGVEKLMMMWGQGEDDTKGREDLSTTHIHAFTTIYTAQLMASLNPLLTTSQCLFV